MIIASIFLILSGVVIIFTIIYLRKKDMINKNIQKRKGRKTLKNLWEIDDVKNGIIVSGNKHTIVMKIGSIDYHLLSEKEQNVLETSLIEIAKMIKYPMQFFSTTEFVDTSEIVKEIEDSISSKTNEKIVKYGNKIKEYLMDLMENRNLYVRKNYVLISCIGSFEKCKYELNSSYENLKFNLLNSRITLDILDDYEILELLHRELNKNTKVKIKDVLKKGGMSLYARGKSNSL
ncbi:MAG: hypothetical protein HFJ45_01020 [Clostridia bacterium]|nr:hypothetical protein [Clostridia bacterium]